MRTERSEWLRTRRDELISLVRHGKVTPEEAEAEAKANGFEPFEQQPQLPAFDPIQEPWWTIVMAVAWIAWRDLKQVRENCAGFRKECTHWIFREWKQPVEGGTKFAVQAGWFLETLSPPTTVRLLLMEAALVATGEVPATSQMSVRDAEAALWRALSECHLIATGLNNEGRPTEIPAREWLYLKLFEDDHRDALKYDALDRREPFTKIVLRRDDLLNLWPRAAAAVHSESWPIESYMLEPVSRPGSAGFVALCSALQWIMTSGGLRPVMMDDKDEWDRAVALLWPLICGGNIELIGLHRGRALTERVPPEALTLVRPLQPLRTEIADMLLSAPSHIACTPYVDEEHWRRDSNDKLYENGQPGPAWTHLQIRKSDLLERWPTSEPKIKAEGDCCRWLVDEIHKSPTCRPKPKSAFWAQAKDRFKPIARRQFNRAWDKALAETGIVSWAKAGRPRTKSNHGTD
jgi:hypothetical protein